MNEFPKARLADIADIITGTTPSSKHPDNWGSGVAFLTPSDLSQASWNPHVSRRLSPAAEARASRRVIAPPAVAVTCIASVGKIGFIREPTLTNQQINTLIALSEKADERYLYYAMAAHRDRLLQVAGGSATPNINKTSLSNEEIPLPSLPEQRAIAATLGALDDKIESNRRATSRIFDLIDAYSDKFGKDLPLVPLSTLTTSVKRSINPSTLDGAVVDHFSLPAFDSGASPERVSAFTIMSNKLMVPQQAILLSRLNPRFNRTWWTSVDPEVPALASTEFLVLTATSEADLAAVWLALRDPFFRSELPRRVTGTSGSHQRLKPDDVLAMDVPDFHAANSELKQAALAMLRAAENLTTQGAQLAVLRDTMLPELLSGRIRVPVEGAET